MSSCDKNAAVDEFVLSVKTPKTLSACPIPKWDDPQCPAVPMPPLWASGGAEHTLVMEFCKGPRKGKQYKLTLPNRPENSVSTLPSISGQTRMDWQSSYCYDGTNTTNGQWLAWSCNGYHDPNVQAGRVVRVKPADPECKDAPMNSDMTLSIGQCGANFAGWVRKRYLKPEPGTRWMTWYGWPRYLPASMIAAGGVGWDIFETIENDEDYKFVSGPSCPALREAKTGGTPVALSGLQGKNFTWGSVRDHVYEYIKSGDYSGKDEIFDSPGQKSCSGECANIDLRLAGHMPKQWFAYEFAQPTNIAEYSWQTMESECPARWDVQSSLDGTTWTHVSSESGQQCGSWDSATKTGVWQNYTTGTERKALHWRWKFVEYSPEGRADGYRLGSIRFSGIDPPPAHIR